MYVYPCYQSLINNIFVTLKSINFALLRHLKIEVLLCIKILNVQHNIRKDKHRVNDVYFYMCHVDLFLHFKIFERFHFWMFSAIY